MPIETKNQISREAEEYSKLAPRKVIERLKKLPGEHSIAVGLSGGVDSSLTAALLVKAGWHVEGLTLWLLKGQGSCCSDGLIDAAGICNELKIPHHLIDSRETFKQEIINELVNGYAQGITPSPCSKCNRSVKFSQMLSWAKANCNLSRIATGHYSRIKYAEEPYENNALSKTKESKHKLLRGLDRNKDQSYFLYDLSQEVLGNVVFPLGDLTKEDTRKEAIKYGLRTANKPESQDLCLSEHHGSMKAFLDNYLPSRKGEIVLSNGKVLGEHDGIEHFTIGQRKGLGISWQKPLHVIRLDPSMNRVIVGTRSEAGMSNCIVGEINWISIDPPQKPLEIEVQLRYRSSPISAKLFPIEPTSQDFERDRPNRCRLEFKDEQFSITPGQAAVFYSEELVLGGGLIKRD